MATNNKPIKKARRQAQPNQGGVLKKFMDASEQQGEYNIWYNKYTGGDRWSRKARERATTRCNIERDTGITKGAEMGEQTCFCWHFAKGFCVKGYECQFLHRLPQEGDQDLGNSVDIFGRERHASHRDDMGGVGSFNSESTTLYVGGISANCKNIVETVRKHFTEWGEIVEPSMYFNIFKSMLNICLNKSIVKVLYSKYVAFVMYKRRQNAEFAREAMMNQSLDNNELLNVRWATEDPNPRVQEQKQYDAEEQLLDAMEKYHPNLAAVVGDPEQYYSYHNENKRKAEAEGEQMVGDPKFGYTYQEDTAAQQQYENDYNAWAWYYWQQQQQQPEGGATSEQPYDHSAYQYYYDANGHYYGHEQGQGAESVPSENNVAQDEVTHSEAKKVKVDHPPQQPEEEEEEEDEEYDFYYDPNEAQVFTYESKSATGEQESDKKDGDKDDAETTQESSKENPSTEQSD
ncbi:Pre-mRNA-splicing factor [Basidiobolus ranarum]|uniref:Pre-mRNA-splicing factor n=1 Tax=Basidiobolus ranarum TaxID=34480 RepID=A0ABR2WPZ0_9FUNG